MEQLQVESERRAKEYDKLKATMQKLEKENYALREQNAEMEEEYVRSARELADLRKLENDFKCRTWLQGAEGKSTVIASSKQDKEEGSHERVRDLRDEARLASKRAESLSSELSTLKGAHETLLASYAESQGRLLDVETSLDAKSRVLSHVESQLEAARAGKQRLSRRNAARCPRDVTGRCLRTGRGF